MPCSYRRLTAQKLDPDEKQAWAAKAHEVNTDKPASEADEEHEEQDHAAPVSEDEPGDQPAAQSRATVLATVLLRSNC